MSTLFYYIFLLFLCIQFYLNLLFFSIQSYPILPSYLTTPTLFLYPLMIHACACTRACAFIIIGILPIRLSPNHIPHLTYFLLFTRIQITVENKKRRNYFSSFFELNNSFNFSSKKSTSTPCTMAASSSVSI